MNKSLRESEKALDTDRPSHGSRQVGDNAENCQKDYDRRMRNAYAMKLQRAVQEGMARRQRDAIEGGQRDDRFLENAGRSGRDPSGGRTSGAG